MIVDSIPTFAKTGKVSSIALIVHSLDLSLSRRLMAVRLHDPADLAGVQDMQIKSGVIVLMHYSESLDVMSL